MVTESWNSSLPLAANIDSFHQCASRWSSKIFGELGRRKRRIIARLAGIQRAMLTHSTTNLRRIDANLREELEAILEEEEVEWRYKSRSEWLAWGDRNTSTFHKSVRGRTKNCKLEALKINGQWCYDEVILKDEAAAFFRNLYTEQSQPILDLIPGGLFPTIESADLALVNAPLSKIEIEVALSQMAPDKAPGPDGIHTRFLQSQWNVVEDSIFSVINDILLGKPLDPSIAQTSIVLVPKCVTPECFADLRPISLCSVVHRLAARVLVNRMRPLMQYTVSPNQVSFISGRSIIDNIIMAQECIHSMSKSKAKTGYLAIKVDLEKAFDRLSWGFIEDTLKELHLPVNFTTAIMTCITDADLSITWNGQLSSRFKPSRGIRQECPLSPYIFVLCMERLGHMIQNAVDDGLWKPLRVSRREVNQVSHLFFADDLLLFCRATVANARMVKTILDNFSAWSGHSVSITKTHVYYSKNVSAELCRSIEVVLGFHTTLSLGTYLGFPLIHARLDRNHFHSLIDKVRRKINGWNVKRLSFAARVTLIKSILNALPLYCMQVTKIPATTIRQIDKLIRRFLWGGDDNTRGCSMVAWNDVCQPLSNGGLNIRHLSIMNDVFMVKLGPEMLTRPEKLWVRVCSEKYRLVAGCPPSIARNGASAIWRSIARAWPTIYDNTHWSIGDGKLANFWLDVWLPCGQPLLAYSTQHLLIDITSTVAEMRGEDGDWNWELIRDGLSSEGIKVLEYATQPLEDAGPDVCYWNGADDGKFRLKDAYNVLACSGWNTPNQLWRYAWDYPGPERVRLFIWLALRKRLMTNEERYRRHLTASTECPVCYANCESLEHIFRKCHVAKQVWRRLFPAFVQTINNSYNFDDWFYGNLGCNMLYDGYQWNVLFGLVCWKLWKRRCLWVFEKKGMSVYELVAQCRTWARLVQSRATTVKPVRSPRLSEWSCPPTGWIKLNCDASMFQGSGVAGGIFRDASGNFIGGYTRPFPFCSVRQAELKAILDGILLAHERGYDPLIIESDCKQAVDIILGEEEIWKCNQTARRINYWRSKMNVVILMHIYREANGAADKLVKIDRNLTHGLVFLEQPPLELDRFIQRDKGPRTRHT